MVLPWLLIEVTFDLQFTTADTGGLVPMQLRLRYSPVREPDSSKALTLPPTAPAVFLSQTLHLVTQSDDANARSSLMMSASFDRNI